DLGGVEHGEPEIAVEAGRDPSRLGVGRREREVGEGARGSDAPYVAAAGASIREPEIAVGPGRDPIRVRGRGRGEREFRDGGRGRRGRDARGGAGGAPAAAGRGALLREPEIAVGAGRVPSRR